MTTAAPHAGVKILIVDDDVDVLRAARLLLKRHFAQVDFEKNPQKIPYLVSNFDYDVILLDMNFTRDLSSGKEGFEWLDRILDINPKATVVLFTAYGDVEMAVRAIKAGAEDVLTKPVSEQALMDGIKSALAHLHQDRSNREWRRGAHALLETLTPREREVFECVVRGKSNKQAGRELGITERTIKAHRQRIFEKLHARTVADLVSLAERLDLLSHQRIAVTDTRPVSID